MNIRDFMPTDCDKLVEILKANNQYGHPEIDGPEAMLRVHQCNAAVFLIAEEDDRLLFTHLLFWLSEIRGAIFSALYRSFVFFVKRL
ncbi:MAG: hypothetical protein ACE5PV_27995, partial [Candidatus Poribacteria bacterium]